MVIRHKRFLDICFEVTGQLGRWKSGKWINMGYVRSWYLSNKLEDLWLDNNTDWEKCTTLEVKCLRYGIWVPL